MTAFSFLKKSLPYLFGCAAMTACLPAKDEGTVPEARTAAKTASVQAQKEPVLSDSLVMTMQKGSCTLLRKVKELRNGDSTAQAAYYDFFQNAQQHFDTFGKHAEIMISGDANGSYYTVMYATDATDPLTNRLMRIVTLSTSDPAHPAYYETQKSGCLYEIEPL